MFARWEADEVNGRARLMLMGLVVRRRRDVVRMLDLNIEVWEDVRVLKCFDVLCTYE
jgi:hypothetical protein